MEDILAIAGGAAAAGTLGLMASGLFAKYTTRGLKHLGVPVLRYRLVGPPLPGSPLNPLRVGGNDFRQQLRYLARRKYTAVTLSEAIDRCGERAFLATNPIALCFDGGYRSLLQHVVPAMSDYELGKATLFLASRSLGQDNDFEVSGRGRSEPMLGVEEVGALARDRGFEIGSMGTLARDLSLLSERDLLADLKDSREELLAIDGVERVDILSYPRDVKITYAAEVIREAGYRAAAWVSLDGLLTPSYQTFSLPRFAMTRKTPLIELALVLSTRLA